MFLKMPRVAGRIERFYNNIIEGKIQQYSAKYLNIWYLESLFGKDPDVAEDVSDDKVQKILTKKLSFCHKLRFLSPLSLQPNVVDLRYSKLWFLLNQMF